MTSISDILTAIERRAERAIAQELRHMIQAVLVIRAELSARDRAHADALLLKLERLAQGQQLTRG